MNIGKKNLRIFLVLLTVLTLFNTFLVFAEDSGNVYVIPIKGEINKSTYQFVQSRLDQVLPKNPSAIIFEIDTYGGLIVEAEKIKNLIVDLDVTTISFVNNKAESAGVLVTIASDKIVMAEGSTIGSAETIPNTEKVLSTWVSILRSIAEQKDRDPELVAAMANKDLEIDGVVVKGELLNLNFKQAKELGLADLVSNDYSDMLKSFNIDYINIVTIDTDFRTNIASLITNPYVSAILLSIGFIGLLVEIFTPGFGAGGTIGLIALSAFFGGNILAGNSNWGVIVIFIAGLALLLIEAAVPGFGIPGIGGLLCVIVSIILASGTIETAIISLSIAIILTVVAAVLLVKYGPRSPYLDKVVLRTTQDKKIGYTSISSKEEYINKEGIALTLLRPSGTIEIDGSRIDAVSEGEFIEKGAKIKVLKIEGSKVIVRKIQ